ncbi:MAG: RsmB/NOP family class I SAM-dependent RNA methyltransferase [Halodesulfurarchaeum sp.]
MDALRRYEPLIEDFDAFLDSIRRPLPTTVRVNGIKADPATVIRAFEETGVDVATRDWNPDLLEIGTEKPGNTWPHVHGWTHGQEELSTLPPLVLDPQPGEVIWAAAAAPGGKATQIADLMDDEGLVIANDDNLGRLSALRANADRLGVTAMAVTNQDARHFSMTEFHHDSVSRALVDAPCTCEGTIRKGGETLETAGKEASVGLATLQTEILQRAVQLTEPGGTVVYSTCTFAPEENEGVVDTVLSETDARVVPFDVPLEHSPGITAWDGHEFDAGLEAAKRFYPHQNDTGGFFVAKLEVGG